jgi:hypothetical protein
MPGACIISIKQWLRDVTRHSEQMSSYGASLRLTLPVDLWRNTGTPNSIEYSSARTIKAKRELAFQPRPLEWIKS